MIEKELFGFGFFIGLVLWEIKGDFLEGLVGGFMGIRRMLESLERFGKVRKVLCGSFI